MTQEMKYILILISPLVLGGIIAAFNAKSINTGTERVETWLRRRQANVIIKRGWFYRFIIIPVLWLIVKFCDWTDSFSHGGLKNGIRVAATIYLIAVWCFLIYAALVLIVVLAMGALAIYIAIKIISNSNSQNKSM